MSERKDPFYTITQQAIRQIVREEVRRASPHLEKTTAHSMRNQDGKLDEYQNGYNECKVSRIDNVSVLVMGKTGNHLTYVPGILIDGVGDMVSLTAKQAISLLSWLEQNRPELTALAEQEQA